MAFKGGAAYVSVATIAPRLFRSAGTLASTGPVVPKAAADGGRPMQVVSDRLFLSRDGGLAVSDGTAAGTVSLGDTAEGWSATVDVVWAGDRWYFPGGQTTTGPDDAVTTDEELWQTDGTPAGTSAAASIDPSDQGTVASLLSADGAVWFTASDGIHGQELYRSIPERRRRLRQTP